MQHDHLWGKHGVAELWIYSPPKPGDIWSCKMFGDSLPTFLHFVLLLRLCFVLNLNNCLPFACWDCEFESRWGQRCLSWMLCVVRVLCDELITLPEESCRVWFVWVWLSVISKPQEWGGLGRLGLSKLVQTNDTLFGSLYYCSSLIVATICSRNM